MKEKSDSQQSKNRGNILDPIKGIYEKTVP